MLFLRLLRGADFPRAIRNDEIVSRARSYITSGSFWNQTFRKMRLRQRNHNRVQQNITAPKE